MSTQVTIFHPVKIWRSSGALIKIKMPAVKLSFFMNKSTCSYNVRVYSVVLFINPLVQTYMWVQHG